MPQRARQTKQKPGNEPGHGRLAPKPTRPGEKRVRPTDQTVPVEPVKVSAEARRPIAPAAVDRRQIVGTDEPRRRGSSSR